MSAHHGRPPAVDERAVTAPPPGTAPPGHGGAPDAGDRPELPAVVPPRAVTLVLAGGLLSVLLLVTMLVPLPYAIQSPGPTADTLGERDGSPLIAVDGAPTYPTAGELRLTTVSVSGGPGYPVTASDVLEAWLDGRRVVLPREAVYPDGTTREELDAESSAQMTSSQTNATVAALEEIGTTVPMELEVVSVGETSGAAGRLGPGDRIDAITPDGGATTEIETFADLVGVLRTVDPGTEVVLAVEREGETLEVAVTTSAPPDVADAPPGSILGVLIRPDVELPVDVEFDIENIGGPSAGMMFALGIVDLLTPGELTGGATVAGTGTVSITGDVGAIGGVRQKMVGAERDGAPWFLAPTSNCDEVVGYVPEGLTVVAVDTLADARAAVERIADGETASLPGCTAP